MITVTLSCARCRKDYARTTTELKYVYLVTDAYTHCDDCEATLKQRGGGDCGRCTAFRKQPYTGEAREFIVPMSKPPKGFRYEGMELVQVHNGPTPYELHKMDISVRKTNDGRVVVRTGDGKSDV